MTFEYVQDGFACCPARTESGSRCCNLLVNPSFEEGLAGWTASENVLPGNDLPFEGTQVADLFCDVAHLFQDVSLEGTGHSPLFLSFNLLGFDQPKFTAEVLWLNEERNPIGTGLRMFIPANTTDNVDDTNARVTFFAVTDRPPQEAAYARLLFSQAFGEACSVTLLDQVILAPVKTGNLVDNPGFEAGLTNWSASGFQTSFATSLEGAGNALATVEGTLSQDVPIDRQPANAPYLFSFGAFVSGAFLPVQVQVLWLDQEGNVIGTPGLDININIGVLGRQRNYLTYLDLTEPAPAGAVAARVLFNPEVDDPQAFFKVDQVILARAGSGNLVENPSFESGADGWTLVNAQVIPSVDAYEGLNVAELEVDGGAVMQDVPLVNAAGHCYLLNFALSVIRAGAETGSSDLLVKVLWLDQRGQEIGVGLNLVAFGINLSGVNPQWLVYTGITERVPAGTAAARILFSKPAGSDARVQIDKVVFGRLV